MLPATEDTKGEIMGITTAINAFAFGTISSVGGGLQVIDEKAPLIVSFVLMFLSWSFWRFEDLARRGRALPNQGPRWSSRKRTEFGFQIESQGFFPVPNVASWSANSGARPEGIPRTREMR